MVAPMPLRAPIRVPVELRRPPRERCFRMAYSISEGGIDFAVPVPETFDGPLEFRLHLPEDPVPLTGAGEVMEVVPSPEGAADPEEGEPRRLALRFSHLAEEARARVARYIEERLLIP
jgi:hypothetical protein